MKKRMLVLCLLAAAVLLTACGAPKTEETAGTPVKVDGEPETLREKVNMVCEDATDLAPLTAEDLEDVLGIPAEDYQDFVFLQSEGTDGREILAIRAVSMDAAKRIAEQAESYLERRRKETRNYAPEAYQLLSEAQVETKNLTVVLVVGKDGAAEAKAILSPVN